MSNQQLAIDQVDVGFDAAKARGQGVEQGMGVLIVVVRVNSSERLRLGAQAHPAAKQGYGTNKARLFEHTIYAEIGRLNLTFRRFFLPQRLPLHHRRWHRLYYVPSRSLGRW